MKPVGHDMNKLPKDESIDEEFEKEDVCVSEVAAAQEGGCQDAVIAGGEEGEQDKEGEARDIGKKEEPEEKDNRCAQEETSPAPEVGDEAKKEDVRLPVSESRQKWVAFSELAVDAVNLARNSVIPPAVMEYYKQFGLDEETIKLIFQMQPSEEASHKPVILPPFKGSPKHRG